MFRDGPPEKRRMCRPRDKVVFRDKLIELSRSQAVVTPKVEDHKVEDLKLAVVQINGAGRRIVWHGLQQQDALGHFNPARSPSLAEGDKDFHYVFDIGLLAQANVLCGKQRFKTDGSSALRHDVFLLDLSDLPRLSTNRHATEGLRRRSTILSSNSACESRAAQQHVTSMAAHSADLVDKKLPTRENRIQCCRAYLRIGVRWKAPMTRRHETGTREATHVLASIAKWIRLPMERMRMGRS
jgi:hypothetical protein